MFFRQFFPENSLMSPSTVKIFDGAIEIRLHSGHWKRKRASLGIGLRDYRYSQLAIKRIAIERTFYLAHSKSEHLGGALNSKLTVYRKTWCAHDRRGGRTPMTDVARMRGRIGRWLDALRTILARHGRKAERLRAQRRHDRRAVHVHRLRWRSLID